MNKSLVAALAGSLFIHAAFAAVPMSGRLSASISDNGIVHVSVVVKEISQAQMIASGQISVTETAADAVKPEDVQAEAQPVKPLSDVSVAEDTEKPQPETQAAYEDTAHGSQLQSTYPQPAGDDGNITPPRELYFPEPKYPVTAKKRRLEGSVVLEISIDNAGNITNMEILRSSGHGSLDNAALSVKDKLKYAPAFKDGEAIEFTLTKTITFVLDNK